MTPLCSGIADRECARLGTSMQEEAGHVISQLAGIGLTVYFLQMPKRIAEMAKTYDGLMLAERDTTKTLGEEVRVRWLRTVAAMKERQVSLLQQEGRFLRIQVLGHLLSSVGVAAHSAGLLANPILAGGGVGLSLLGFMVRRGQRDQRIELINEKTETEVALKQLSNKAYEQASTQLHRKTLSEKERRAARETFARSTLDRLKVVRSEASERAKESRGFITALTSREGVAALGGAAAAFYLGAKAFKAIARTPAGVILWSAFTLPLNCYQHLADEYEL